MLVVATAETFRDSGQITGDLSAMWPGLQQPGLTYRSARHAQGMTSIRKGMRSANWLEPTANSLSSPQVSRSSEGSCCLPTGLSTHRLHQRLKQPVKDRL